MELHKGRKQQRINMEGIGEHASEGMIYKMSGDLYSKNARNRIYKRN